FRVGKIVASESQGSRNGNLGLEDATALRLWRQISNSITIRPMCTDRRDFLRASAGLAGAAFFSKGFAFADTSEIEAIQQRQDVPAVIRNLRRMTADVVPISDDERKARIAKAQRLMGERKIDAIYIEPGSSMFYFTGVRWGTSERMFAAVIPQRGELAWVCPKFEEERARELIRFGNDVRTWEEDASP